MVRPQPRRDGLGDVPVLQPGEANGYYHAEDAQEGPGTEHITVGAGDEPCAILMFGSPDPRRKVSWIANATAAYGASVAKTTSVGTEVYGEVELACVPAPSPFGAPRS